MQRDDWNRLIPRLTVGKRVSDAVYLHASAVPPELQELVDDAQRIARCAPDAFNVVKLTSSGTKVSLLDYRAFYTEGFPLLRAAWTVNLSTGNAEFRSYADDPNPAVLHRKELMLRADHPLRPEFVRLTERAEQLGLFSDPAIIGHALQWQEELRARGVRCVGNELLEGVDGEPSVEIARHRTALSRRGLSTPMQALWRHGYLSGAYSVFDYGCGRGDDVAALQAQGIAVGAWDPHFRPDGVKVPADVVNLGFVLNVIESPRERAEAVRGAFELANVVLAVAVLIGGRTAYEKFRLFRDGVLTSRGTFQKYFTQPELAAYLTEVLGREPLAIGPGLFFVFKTDAAEQAFLECRQRSPVRVSLPKPPPKDRQPRSSARRTNKPKRLSRWELHHDLVSQFWNMCLSLGRAPRATEFAQLAQLEESVGSPGRVLRHLIDQGGAEALARGRERRRESLLVYLALNLFERRRSFRALPETIQQDIRDHWGTFARAEEAAGAMLFSLRDSELIARECTSTASRGIGYLVEGDALYLDARLINDLPASVRLYVGCAGRLHGEAQDADVVKIHFASGKLSVMTYDDYERYAVPLLIERVKIDLRRQHVSYFEYGDEYPPQPLYFKSRYMTEQLDGYSAQRAFDEQALAIESVDWSGFGPAIAEVGERLRAIDRSTELELGSWAQSAAN